jgi:trehalose utilization protein
LKQKVYKKQRVYGWTEIQNGARVCKYEYKQLLNWHADDDIIFSDENMFHLQESNNQQNAEVYAVPLVDIPRVKLAVKWFQNVFRVIVSNTIWKKGKLPILFMQAGVKNNQDYYIEHLFEHAKNCTEKTTLVSSKILGHPTMPN